VSHKAASVWEAKTHQQIEADKIAQVDQLFVTAIRYAINVVSGVAEGAAVPLHQANPVAVAAVEYALSHAAPFIQGTLGDPEKLAEKIWAHMPLDPAVTMPDFASIARQAKI